MIRAKEYQQKIYAYSLYILHANRDYDIDIKEINAKSDSVSTILSTNGVAKKDQNTFADAMNYMLRMPHYRNLMLKYISQFKTINKFVALVDSINDYYSKSDSSLISTQLNLKGLEGLKSYMITQEINQEALYKQLNQMNERIEDSKSLDFSSQSRIRYEESEKIRKCLEKLLKDGSFEKTVDSVYNLSTDIIGILNLVQLKYAYNIDL